MPEQQFGAINWNFDPSIPTRHFLDDIDLDDNVGRQEAVEDFVRRMRTDRFRTWESVIREEQGLSCTTLLEDLRTDPFSIRDHGTPTTHIAGSKRDSEPWFEFFRRIAPRLLVEPLRTSDYQDDVINRGWLDAVSAVENHGRDLSLPPGVTRPLDVLPADLQHSLWVQYCCDHLCGLGQFEATLEDEEQHWRIDDCIENLKQHRESVEFVGLTLDGLLQRCELPERDRPIFVRLVSERLNLLGTDRPLAPCLSDAVQTVERIERLPEEDIKRAILHPEPFVRDIALDFLLAGRSCDVTLAPLVIEAIDRYGWGEAFPQICLPTEIPQTSETVTWLCAKIEEMNSLKEMTSSTEDVDEEFDGLPEDDASMFHDLLCDALLSVHPTLLEQCVANIGAMLQDSEPELLIVLRHQISDSHRDADDLWTCFEEFLQKHGDDQAWYEPGELEHLAQLLKTDERLAGWVHDTLARTVNDPGYRESFTGFAVIVAGLLRLESAALRLVDLLYEEDDLAFFAAESLSSIGGDPVIDALNYRFSRANSWFRHSAAGILEKIPTDRSVQTLLDWLKWERNDGVTSRILLALLNGFVPAAIERARQLLVDAELSGNMSRRLRVGTVAVCLLGGTEFPELQSWTEAAGEDYDRWLNLCGSDSDDDDDWDDDDLDDWDDDWDEDNESSILSLHRGRPADSSVDPFADLGLVNDPDEGIAKPIVNVGGKIGRNAPCPCGSGKKYKKCCLKKDQG